MEQLMEQLMEQAKTSPQELSDTDLCTVFGFLTYSPQEDLSPSDLLDEMHNRESKGSYEIIRGLALYYSDTENLEDELTEDTTYQKGLSYICRAFKLRDESFNSRFEKFEEFDDSYLERDLVFGFGTLLNYYIYDIEELIEDLEDNQELVQQTKLFIELAEEKLHDSNDLLDLLRIAQSNCEPYLEFVQQCMQKINTLEPEDEADFDEFEYQIDDVQNNLNQLMNTQIEKIEALFKKTLIHSILWLVIAAVVYFVFPGKWYIYIPAVIAVITVGCCIFVARLRIKLKSTLD